MSIKNQVRLLSAAANVNATSRYAKCDFDPRYIFLNVNVEAGKSIVAATRQA